MSKFPTQQNRELIGPYQGIKSAHQGSFLPDQGRVTLVGAFPHGKSEYRTGRIDIDQLHREVPVGNVGGDPQLRRDRPGHVEALRLLEQVIACVSARRRDPTHNPP
jgi:hypothetical protein